MSGTARILLAEDDVVVAAVIEDILNADGYEVVTCPDGRSAWESLEANVESWDVILLDRGMPDMDGLEVLRRIKSDPRLEHLPVIMETAMEDQDSIREGLAAGAYYYLTKPFEPHVLEAIVQTALEQIRELRRLRDSVREAERPLGMLEEGLFRFRDLDQARLLASFLARACPEPARTVTGLQELLANAVEHGNLGLSYGDKSALLKEGTWDQEIQRRLDLPEYRGRSAQVRFIREADRLSFTLQDQGAGFDWRGYLDFAPERAFDLHGRGIALARRMSFDSLEYQGNGNTVVASVSLSPAPAGGTTNDLWTGAISKSDD